MAKFIPALGIVLLVSTSAIAQEDPAEEIAGDWPDNKTAFGGSQYTHQPENVGIPLENIGTQDSAMGLYLQEKDKKRESILSTLILEKEQQLAGQAAGQPDEMKKDGKCECK